MERNKEMIDEINRICEKYPDLKATKEYFEHLEDKEKNGSTINSMQIMYALVRIKEINKNEKILKRANVKEETKEQRRADMDQMSEQVEKSILNDRKRKKLKLADDMEPGTRFSSNKEMIYEQLSKQIKYLQSVMKTAEKERMKEVNKSKESDLEAGWVKESRIPASIWLKSCDRYVKGQMRKIKKEKEKKISNDGAAVILNDEDSEKSEKIEDVETEPEVQEKTDEVAVPEKKEEPTEQVVESKEEVANVEEVKTEPEVQEETGEVVVPEQKEEHTEQVVEPKEEVVKAEEKTDPEIRKQNKVVNRKPETPVKQEVIQQTSQSFAKPRGENVRQQFVNKEDKKEVQSKTNKIEATKPKNRVYPSSLTSEQSSETKLEEPHTYAEMNSAKKSEPVKKVAEENTTSESIKQLDDWASQVVTKVNKGEKIDDILKENITTEAIIENIKKGDININDAKKAINNKCVKENGQIDEKLAAAIAKYLIQRTNIIKTHNIETGDIMIAVSSKDLIRKPTLWEKVKSFFKGIGSKIKGIFTRNKTKKTEKSESDVNPIGSAKKDEFKKRILADPKNIQIKTSDGKYIATKYTIIGNPEKNEENNSVVKKEESTGQERVD